jgi:hypothetical protein
MSTRVEGRKKKASGKEVETDSCTGGGLNKDADGGHEEGEPEDGLVQLPETHDVVMVHHTNGHLWEEPQRRDSLNNSR